MIVVDSSVWIDSLRRRTTPQTELLDNLAPTEAIAVPDLCLYEILQGIRPASAMNKVHEQLREFSIVPIGGEYVALTAAQNAQTLKAHGIQPSVVDCLLATYCILNGLRLLTSDKDFEAFATHLGLDLV
jgi:predicted nucleic acid-binding protein